MSRKTGVKKTRNYKPKKKLKQIGKKEKNIRNMSRKTDEDRLQKRTKKKIFKIDQCIKINFNDNCNKNNY